jgi:hypothetical protein
MPGTTRYINVSYYDGALHFHDSEGNEGTDITTGVDPGDTVIWRIGSKGGLYSIESVSKKADSRYNLLVNPPSRNPHENFQGDVVQISPAPHAEESYNISYKLVEGGPTIPDDPKLRMLR